MADRTRRIGIEVRAGGTERTARQLRAVRREVIDLGRIGGIAGRGLSTAAANLAKLGAAAGALAVGAGVAAVRWAADFEAQLNTINTIARATPDGLRQIGDQIRAVARETGTPLDELTQGYYDLLSAGISAAHATDVLRAANALAIGGLASTAQTVDLLTTAINTYGGDASRAAAMADVFAKAIERGKVTAADLAASFATVGPVAASAGIELEELGAAYAQLTALGVPAAEAATQVRSAIVALMRRTGDLEKLEKKTGKSYLAIAGRKGLVVALEELRRDAQKAGVPLIDLLGRVEGLSFTLATTGPNLASYNENLAAMRDAAGTAAEQMGERQKGLSFALARLQANVRDAGIEIGTALLPVVADLADELTRFLQDNRGRLTEFGQQLAGAFREAVDWAKQLDWAKIGEGLRVAADLAGKVIQAFAAAPPEVQGLILALAGLDRLTGGAISEITTELGKGLIRGVLGITAGVVNVNAGVVRGTGGPTVVGGGGKGGGVLGRFGPLVGTLGRLGAGAAGVGLLTNLPETREAPAQRMFQSAAGGALGGFALGGPAGAVAGGLGGFVAGIRDAIEAWGTETADKVAAALDRNLARMRPDELETALRAVEQGIADITSNPLHVLVAGPALDRLQEMRDALQRQLAAERAKPDRLRRVGEGGRADTSGELRRMRQIPTLLGDLRTQIRTIPGAVSQIGPKVASAIGALPPPKVTVNVTAQITNQVKISQRELMSSQHVVARVGRMVAV